MNTVHDVVADDDAEAVVGDCDSAWWVDNLLVRIDPPALVAGVPRTHHGVSRAIRVDSGAATGRSHLLLLLVKTNPVCGSFREAAVAFGVRSGDAFFLVLVVPLCLFHWPVVVGLVYHRSALPPTPCPLGE